MPFEGAIFDMDGVVVDTVPLHFKAWQRMFAEEGMSFTFEDYMKKVDGIPRLDGARAVLPHLSEDQLKAASDRKQSYFLGLLESELIPVYDTTLALMRRMKAEKVKIAIISSSKNCKRILEQAKIPTICEAIVDGHQITKGKPDPQIFLLAADRLGLKPSSCVGFEDAILGVEAVKNAGMACVGVDRYGKPERLSKADIVVSDLGQISFGQIKGLLDE